MKNSNWLWILSICLIVSFLDSSTLFASDIDKECTNVNPEFLSTEMANAQGNYVAVISRGTTGPSEGAWIQITKASDPYSVAFHGIATVGGVGEPPYFYLDEEETYKLRIFGSGSVQYVHVQNSTYLSGSGSDWKFTTGKRDGYIHISYK